MAQQMSRIEVCKHMFGGKLNRPTYTHNTFCHEYHHMLGYFIILA